MRNVTGISVSGSNKDCSSVIVLLRCLCFLFVGFVGFYRGGVLSLLALVASFLLGTSFGIVVVHAGLFLASHNVVGIVDIALLDPQCFYRGGILSPLALVASFLRGTSFGIVVVHAGLVLASHNAVGIVDTALVGLEIAAGSFADTLAALFDHLLLVGNAPGSTDNLALQAPVVPTCNAPDMQDIRICHPYAFDTVLDIGHSHHN